MLADLFSKTAVLALAAMAYATPVSFYASDLESGANESSDIKSGAGDSSDFKSQMLAAHNWYRAQHSAAPLEWDDDLASNALAWASKCSENPRHQPGHPHGENIAWGTGSYSPYQWVNLWGKERVDYNFDRPGYVSGTGHFTQVVWKGTTRVGCGEAQCSFGTNVVCEYDPAGNIIGANNKYFRDNVGRQTSGQIRDEYQG
ncbi:hypothetical protein MY11210_005476 [Beauveria gryllotalpidicola]